MKSTKDQRSVAKLGRMTDVVGSIILKFLKFTNKLFTHSLFTNKILGGNQWEINYNNQCETEQKQGIWNAAILIFHKEFQGNY